MPTAFVCCTTRFGVTEVIRNVNADIMSRSRIQAWAKHPGMYRNTHPRLRQPFREVRSNRHNNLTATGPWAAETLLHCDKTLTFTVPHARRQKCCHERVLPQQGCVASDRTHERLLLRKGSVTSARFPFEPIVQGTLELDLCSLIPCESGFPNFFVFLFPVSCT